MWSNIFSKLVVDFVVTTNISYQSIKGCVAQQPRKTLFVLIVEENGNVQDKTFYHKTNSISYYVIANFLQILTIDTSTIIHHSSQIMEGYDAQRPRQPLSAIIVEIVNSVQGGTLYHRINHFI